MAEQRERAKADARAKQGQHADTGVYRGGPRRARPDRVARLRDPRDRVQRARAARSAARRRRRSTAGDVGELVLDRTPFYAESGGQVADAGTIEFDGGRLEVLDVQRPIKGLVVHQVRVVEGEFTPGDHVLHARVDPEWRTGARQAHSGTHVVHAALREVLGPTALQSGSYNRPGYLRLDFGWTTGLTPEQVRDIEHGLQPGAARRPAGRLAVHDARRGQGVGRDRALRRDLRQHQGARRRDRRPLVARALRRHPRRPLLADRHRRRDRRVLRRLRQPPDRGAHRRRGLRLPRPRARRRRPADRAAQDPARRPGRPGRRPGRAAARRREGDREGPGRPAARRRAATLAAGATKVGPVNVVAHRADGAGGGDVRTLALDVRGRLPQGEPGVVVIIGAADGKVSVVAAVNDEARARGLSANDLVRAVGPLVGGKGGGKDDVAQGGGTDASRIDEALALVAAEVGRVAAGLRRAARRTAGHRPGRRPDRGGAQRPLRLPGHPGRDRAPRQGRPAPDRADLVAEQGSRRSSRWSSACPGRSPAARVRRRPRRASSRPRWRAGLHPCPVRLCRRADDHGVGGGDAARPGSQGGEAARRGGPGRGRPDPAARAGHRARHGGRAGRDRRGDADADEHDPDRR